MFFTPIFSYSTSEIQKFGGSQTIFGRGEKFLEGFLKVRWCFQKFGGVSNISDISTTVMETLLQYLKSI